MSSKEYSNPARSARGTKRRRIGVVLSAIGAVPITAAAAWPEQGRGLADKLRDGPGEMNHPVHVVPSSAVRIPKGWPLDVDGSIKCTTCHESLPSLDGSTGPRLRGGGERTGGFCVNCHGSSPRASAAMHWQAVQTAHIRYDQDSAKSPAGALDGGSVACLGCHDGVTAGESRYETAWNRGAGSMGDAARNHPIGVAYPHAGNKRKGVQLRPTALLPRSVRLPAGTVSCVSCHDLYQTEAGRLTVPIEGSRLCMTCHPMDE